MYLTSEKRKELDAKLRTFCKNVYYQPPLSFKMAFPCIVYERNREDTLYANSNPYINRTGIQFTLIHQDPDIILDMSNDFKKMFPLASWQRDHTTDGLHHVQFVLNNL